MKMVAVNYSFCLSNYSLAMVAFGLLSILTQLVFQQGKISLGNPRCLWTTHSFRCFLIL